MEPISRSPIYSLPEALDKGEDSKRKLKRNAEDFGLSHTGNPEGKVPYQDPQPETSPIIHQKQNLLSERISTKATGLLQSPDGLNSVIYYQIPLSKNETLDDESEQEICYGEVPVKIPDVEMKEKVKDQAAEEITLNIPIKILELSIDDEDDSLEDLEEYAASDVESISQQRALEKVAVVKDDELFRRGDDGKLELFISKAFSEILKAAYPTRKEFMVFVQHLSELVDKYAIPYPFRTITLQQALQDFRMLQQMPGILNHINGRQIKYKVSFKDSPYDPLDPKKNIHFSACQIKRLKQGIDASDFCQKMYRITCGENRPKLVCGTPLSAWQQLTRRTRVLGGLYHSIGERDITRKTVERTVEKNSNTCWDWRPHIYKDIILALKQIGFQCSSNHTIDVLDTSSGFGGRIVGAMAIEGIKSYTGFDPNRNLYPGYKKILSHYGPLTPTVVRLICKPSEEMTSKDFGPAKTFKLLVTSPPYADREKYTSDPTQSWVRYIGSGKREAHVSIKDSIQNWLEGYLFRALFKAWKRLEPGGIMALNLCDFRQTGRSKGTNIHLCEPTIDFLKNLGIEYLGCIALMMGISNEPIWILRKPLQASSAYQWTFKSSENRDFPSLAKQYALYRNRSIVEQRWTACFFMPKFWNQVAKWKEREIKQGNVVSNSEIVNALMIPEGIVEMTLKKYKKEGSNPMMLQGEKGIINLLNVHASPSRG